MRGSQQRAYEMGLSGKASEALQGRKTERTDRPSRIAAIKGPNGGRSRMARRVQEQVGVWVV